MRILNAKAVYDKQNDDADYAGKERQAVRGKCTFSTFLLIFIGKQKLNAKQYNAQAD